MLKNLFISLPLLASFSAQALETDNYIAWEKELKDSSDSINGFIASEIQIALDKANNKRKIQSCRNVTFHVARRFRALAPIRHPLEDWIRTELTEEQVFPHSNSWVKKSIYRDAFRFYLKNMPIAPNVQINGFYLGTDKLSHFSSTGRRYLAHYLKKIKKGMEHEEAVKSAIRYGLGTEATTLGLWAAGVFSYGDLEANYQGLLFYKKMCMNESDNYLEQDEEGSWKMVKAPDIRDYVSAYWDETFNLSYRLPKNWFKTSKIIKQFYCPQNMIGLGANRLERYRQSNHTSFSLEYIRELQAEGYYRAPKPVEEQQSFTDLCEGLSPEV